MIIGGGKKKATQFLSKLMGDKSQPSPVEVKPEGESDPGMDMLKGLSEDIMMALQNKSASDFSRALKAFIEECSSTNDEE